MTHRRFKRTVVNRSVVTVTTMVGLLSLVAKASAVNVALQNVSATGSQGGWTVDKITDNSYSTANGQGWADDIAGATVSQIAVAETVTDLDLSNGGVLRFNLFQGLGGSHFVGRYRLSYTTDSRATFADGLVNGGDVTATWTTLAPNAMVASNGATMVLQGDNSIKVTGGTPDWTTDTLMATVGPIAAPITGFRLETIEDASFPTNGPGRAGNGNYVVREFDVAAFQGEKVTLQNATARFSQGGFSPDNVVNGLFDFIDIGAAGWANAGHDIENTATFETATNISSEGDTVFTMELVSGWGGDHTLGKFRISATTADRSLFADGNDNGGFGVGNEGIWTVLDPLSIESDRGTTTFIEDATHAILASGPNLGYEHYTLQFRTTIDGITGFRIQMLEDPSLPSSGPGRSANGNFVFREFTVFSRNQPIPEPATATLGLFSVAGLMRRRRRMA